MAECGESVDVVQTMDKNASLSSSNSSFSTRAGFDSPLEAKASSELQNKASGQPNFCALCKLTFNSESQTQEHLRGKVHLNRVKRLSNESSFTASGLNQNMSHAEMTDKRMHKPFRKQMAKRMVDDSERNGQSKKPKLFLDTASKPKCSKPHLFEKLHHKTPFAVLNECRKGLVVVCKRHGISRVLSFTASLELNGKAYSETGNSRAMAKQLLAETVISEMEQEIEKMDEKHGAMRLAFHNKDETEESLPAAAATAAAATAAATTAADQEVLQRPPPFDTAVQGSDHVDLTSNDDICRSTQSSTFDSVDTSATGQQFESSISITPTSDNRKLESEVNVEDSAASSAKSSTFSKGNAYQRPDIIKKRTAVAILDCLIPGVKWNVTKHSMVTVESPSKEFVVSIKANGQNFEGCSRAIYLARHYAAEAALNKLFGMEFTRDAGIPVYLGKLAEIARLKKGKLKNTNFLDVLGKNPIIALKKVFKDEVSFQFHPHFSSGTGFKQWCTVSVAGMNFEGCYRFKKKAKKRAAFAALAVLRANGMYDQKAAELKAHPTGVPVQQTMVQQRAPSSAISVGSNWPVTHTKSPLPVHALSRLNSVFPESRYTFRAHKMDLNGKKGKIFTVDLFVGDQKFVGKGEKLRCARADASKKALRAFGLWGDLNDQAQAQLHVAPELKERIHEKQLARGRGKSSAARGNRRNHNYLSTDSGYFGAESVGNSCIGHSDYQGRGFSERSYKNNYIPIDVNSYVPGDNQPSFMGSEIERGNDGGNDMSIGGNYYSTRNKQTRFMDSGVERGYNKNSDVLIGGNYYGTGNKQKRFMDSGVERGYNKISDILIGGSYYGTGNKRTRFVDSGVEREYNKNSDVLIDGNYYDTRDERVRFMSSGIERRNDNSNNILMEASFDDTDDRHVSFVGSGISFARRNEGAPSVNKNINYRLLNMAGGTSTGPSVSAFETAYRNNEYEYKPFRSFNAGDPYNRGIH